MKLKKSEFNEIRTMIYDYCGINLHNGKEALVRARLMKRMRQLEIPGFSNYLKFLKGDKSGAEFLALVDVLTTNKTNFFREDQHFDFIRDEVIPKMEGRSVKWWSAGCSTGEEPISCAITLLEENEIDFSAKILATDLSREVLQFAKAGIYPAKKVQEIPPSLRKKYFSKEKEGQLSLNKEIRSMITYGRLNLKRPWPLKGPFHVIMCRNVMIYFNKETQQKMVSRFCDILEPGGFLFLGHSESVTADNKDFVNIRPAVYQKRM